MATQALGGYAVTVPIRRFPNTAWRAALADGTVSHLNPERVRLYGALYNQGEELTKFEINEVAELDVLAERIFIPPSDKIYFLRRIKQEITLNALRRLEAYQYMGRAQAIFGKGDAGAMEYVLRQSNTYKSCQTLGLLEPGSPPSRIPDDPQAAFNSQVTSK